MRDFCRYFLLENWASRIGDNADTAWIFEYEKDCRHSLVWWKRYISTIHSNKLYSSYPHHTLEMPSCWSNPSQQKMVVERKKSCWWHTKEVKETHKRASSTLLIVYQKHDLSSLAISCCPQKSTKGCNPQLARSQIKLWCKTIVDCWSFKHV